MNIKDLINLCPRCFGYIYSCDHNVSKCVCYSSFEEIEDRLCRLLETDFFKQKLEVKKLLKNVSLNRYWIALYSASGREILEISKRIGKFPDRIITNQKDISKTIPELLAICEKENIDFVQITNPQINDYRELFLPDSLITMHGYLKILPPQICDESYILNCHPGNTINRNANVPVIIGKDPQRKALEIRAPYVGVTIHEATAELDGGKILAYEQVKNDYTNAFLTEETLTKFCNQLRDVAINLWIPILKEKLQYESTN